MTATQEQAVCCPCWFEWRLHGKDH